MQPPFKYPSFANEVESDTGDEEEGTEPSIGCGAMIIKENWAITAAHCVKLWGLGVTNFSVLAGRQHLTARGNRTKCTRRRYHFSSEHH